MGMAIILIIFAFIFVLGPLARAYAGRMNRELPDPGHSQAEIARLREEMDLLAVQVSRLTDEQSFLLRLVEKQDSSPADRRLESGRSDADLP